jgi:hypothetical protein
MKFNLVPTVIAVAISGLCAYAFYNWCAEPENILVAIFGGITMCCTLSTALGCVFQRERTSANIKILSGVFAFLFLVSNIIFCCLSSFANPVYICVNGFLLLIWLLTTYSIYKSMN